MNRIINTTLATLIFAAGLFSCESPVQRNTAPVSEITAEMDSILTPMFPDNLPGALVMVMKNDSIKYSHSFGMANFINNSPVTDSTMFNIASLTKQFTAIGLLKLHEQGLLSLEDSITKFLPELQNPIFKKVKIKHLLNHTSGLPDARPRTQEEWDVYRQKADSCVFGRLEDYKLYGRADEGRRTFHYVKELKFEPGTEFDYQNCTYQLAYYIVPAVTGVDFETWMNENVFRPAGMKHHWFFHQNFRYANMSHGYTTEQNAISDDMPLGTLTPDGKYGEYDYGEAPFFPTWADGGLYLTGPDFMTWIKALKNNAVVADSTLNMAMTPYINSDWPEAQYGYGMYVQNLPGQSRKVFHHGSNGGYFAYEAYFPDRDVAYLIFSNRNDWDRRELANQIDSILKQHNWI